MKKYRLKTKEEFLNDGLWIHDSYSRHDGGYPEGWADDGEMNKYLGQDIPDKFNPFMEKNRPFRMDGWQFEPCDYILKEEEPVNIEEALEQVKQLNKNSLKTKKAMKTTKNAAKKNPVAEKFVFMDKTVNILNVGYSTGKNVILYGPGE